MGYDEISTASNDNVAVLPTSFASQSFASEMAGSLHNSDSVSNVSAQNYLQNTNFGIDFGSANHHPAPPSDSEAAANPKFGAAAEPESLCAATAERETLHYEAAYAPGTARPEYNAERMLGKLNDGTSVWSHLNDADWVYNNLDLVKTALKNAIVHDNRDQYMQRLWGDVAAHSDGAIRYTPGHTNFWNNYVGAKLELVKGVVFNRSLLD